MFKIMSMKEWTFNLSHLHNFMIFSETILNLMMYSRETFMFIMPFLGIIGVDFMEHDQN